MLNLIRHIQCGLATPDMSGWNVISTSQISTDGKEQSNKTLATTDSVRDVHGGKSTFSGKNEQIESHRHDGDDKNYTTTSGYASNTVLKEHTVTGDDNNGRTESSSNTTSTSSKTITSTNYHSDNVANEDFVQEFEGILNSARRSAREHTNKSNANNEQFERNPDHEKENFNTKTTNKTTTSSSSNQQSTYEMRRSSASSTTSSVDAKKIQRETEYLANAPGKIISRSVEYPDANTKVITETKTLADGSTVTTTKYETRAASSTTTSTSSKQEKSSTSRVVTEDRAERNRIEIISGDGKNVNDNMVTSKRFVDTHNDSELVQGDNKENVKTEFHRNENRRYDDTPTETSNHESTRIDTSVVKNQEKTVRNEEILKQKPYRETSPDRTERQQSENVTSRLELDIVVDNKLNVNTAGQRNSDEIQVKQSWDSETHKTVKKDLSQENDLPDEQFDRRPVEEEQIVPKKQIYHICSPSHDHSKPKPDHKPDSINKRISVDHNPTHEAFARSLRCVTPESDKRSVQSSLHSVKTNSMYTERDRRSPSRDTNLSDASKISSTTVTKSYSPNRKPSSPDNKRKPTLSSETIDMSSDHRKSNERKTESTTVRKSVSKSEDHYDHPKNNQPVYDIPSNNAPVQSIRKNSSSQPGYYRPTESSTRHNNKPESDDVNSKPKKQPKDYDEPIYETIGDRPTNQRRPSSKTTFSTSVTQDTNRNADKLLKKQSAANQLDYESNFDSGRSNSPTSSVSDIEYVNFTNTNRKVTDLDEVEIVINTKEKSITNSEDTRDGLFLSTHKKKHFTTTESDTDIIVERDDNAKKPFYLNESQTETKPTRKEKPPLTRSETYEERCRSMLGMKQASVDLISSERKVENRSPSKSPDRKNSLNAERSPSQSPERKSKISSQTMDEDRRFDTFTRSTLPKPSERNEREEKIDLSTETFDRKTSKKTNRSSSNSPERKRKPSDSLPEVTKQFIKQEARSNSFTTRTVSAKETKHEATTTKTTRETSPKREPISPARSPNRSPNLSPTRNSQGLKDVTKKTASSENEVKNVVRKRSKSELKNSIEDREVKLAQNSKVNKINNEPRTADRTSPTRTKTDETFTETTETFFSETKADTIKRRPSEGKGSVAKSNSTSPDRKSSRPTSVQSRKSATEETKQSPKKLTQLPVTTDTGDTNTFTRKKPFESNETLPSPTKSKIKSETSFVSTSTVVTSGKNASSPSKTKSKSTKIDVKTKSKSKPSNSYSTDDGDTDDEINGKKLTKKVPITERKDSAPVYRSTKVDKDVKMARSTSEHFSSTSRKGSKPDIEAPKSPQKNDKRPTKCMTTKTINLSTTRTLNSEDMENVIIDIQQAKSSREPTPNRIIPTPVSPEEDTGKPRYPDTVHEPDDDRPKRRPNVKNIPIFEEDTKEFISCHITEVCDEYDGTDSDECMLSVSDKVTKFSNTETGPANDKIKRTIVETVNEFSDDVDDECRLSVQGKVSRFTAIAEEVNTAKSTSNTRKECATTTKVNEKVAKFTEKVVENSMPSKPFKNIDRKTRRDFEDIDETLKSDECLLSVSDKVNKFVATAESLTASVPHMSDVKSPELVAKIHRQVSLRDTVAKTDHQDDVHEKRTSKGKITDRYVPNKTKTAAPTATVPISLSSIDVVKKAKSFFERDDSPKAAPKQRDILTRPSIWEQKRLEATKTDVKLTGEWKVHF